ncbi:MAG: hypothetical protein FJ128_13735 [Deltaproteobacteria bacterium]|nr:hypothetical protein [Deltaproteobacteria bacterium]
MKINCLSCGHKVELDDAYDDFEGQVKCFVCTALLEIKTEEGNLKTVRFVKLVPRPGVWGEGAAI